MGNEKEKELDDSREKWEKQKIKKETENKKIKKHVA